MDILLLKDSIFEVNILQIRTDLALESYESKEKTELDGVIVKEEGNVTTVSVINENGAKALGKPVGTYITLGVKSFVYDTDIFDGRLDEFRTVLRSVFPKNMRSVLVAGLGNINITADSLGPKANNYVLATRHIAEQFRKHAGFEGLFCVSSVDTGVLGDTGIESAEIIKGVAAQVKPSCVIAVDALAASSFDRLGNTVQFSDGGIFPGSGVGNHRFEVSERTLGIPVVSIGIPTVVNARSESGGAVYVTPREIDRICEQGAKLIGMGINVSLHEGIRPEELYALVG